MNQKILELLQQYEPVAEGLHICNLTQYRERLKAQAQISKPQRSEQFQFILILKGEGRHFIDFSWHTYQANQMIMIRPNQLHAFEDNSSYGVVISVSNYYFAAGAANIRSSYFAPMHLSMSYSPIVPLDTDLAESCKNIIVEMVKAQQCGDSNVVLQLLLSVLKFKLSKRRLEQFAHLTDQQKQKFATLLTLIDENYKSIRDAASYVLLMYSNAKSLNNLTKSACGKSVKELIDFRMLMESKRLLTLDGYSVQQAASELGFEDATYFVKYFKRHTQQTPAAFKRQFDANMWPTQI